jgi:3-deoxy-manno-octulosonate cytidylyltransferase (CMP-KDO synthetase)
MQSERLPGKPLRIIQGKTMIQRIWERLFGHFDADIVVATDSVEIFQHIESIGGKAVITSGSHNSGTLRCIEAFEILNKRKGRKEKYHLLINVQGDEPLIEPKQLSELAVQFDHEAVQIATLTAKIDNIEDIANPNVVKVVTGKSAFGFQRALYFSRSAIPFHRDPNATNKDFLKHVGIYAFRTKVLPALKKLKPSTLEEAEKLEQLRWLARGLDIAVALTKYKNMGVDTEADLVAVNNFLKTSGKL